MGFVVLFNTSIILFIARPRKLQKLSGPLVEWAAFRELQYVLFAIAIAFSLMGIYTA